MLKARLPKATHTKVVIRQTLVARCFMPIIPDAIPSDWETLTRPGKNAAPLTSLSLQKLKFFVFQGNNKKKKPKPKNNPKSFISKGEKNPLVSLKKEEKKFNTTMF